MLLGRGWGSVAKISSCATQRAPRAGVKRKAVNTVEPDLVYGVGECCVYDLTGPHDCLSREVPIMQRKRQTLRHIKQSAGICREETEPDSKPVSAGILTRFPRLRGGASGE